MKLVPLRQAQVKYMNCLKAKSFTGLKLLTFKKDRFVEVRLQDDGMHLIESGYLNQDILLDGKEAKKRLKDAFNREFPRSTRLYLEE